MNTIIHTLQHLEYDEDERSESVAQSLDLLAQSLEALDMRINQTEQRTKRSFGGHARHLQAIGADENCVAKLNEIRAFRKTLNPTKLSEDGVRDLVQHIMEFSQLSETENIIGERRVRYRPHLTNTVGIETTLYSSGAN